MAFEFWQWECEFTGNTGDTYEIIILCKGTLD